MRKGGGNPKYFLHNWPFWVPSLLPSFPPSPQMKIHFAPCLETIEPSPSPLDRAKGMAPQTARKPPNPKTRGFFRGAQAKGAVSGQSPGGLLPGAGPQRGALALRRRWNSWGSGEDGPGVKSEGSMSGIWL